MQPWWAFFQKQTKNTNPNIKCFDMFYRMPYSFKRNDMMVIASSSNTEQHVHTPLKKSDSMTFLNAGG